jgi:hypothetical protein
MKCVKRMMVGEVASLQGAVFELRTIGRPTRQSAGAAAVSRSHDPRESDGAP